MDTRELETTARALVPPGKGILAADESPRTIQKRLESVGVPSTEETRRAYREMLFTTPGIEEFLSGVILYDETIRQAAQDGTPFVEVLSRKGIIPGIKVDLGTADLAGFPGEKITEGLDGLRERLVEYRGLGARFTKWRAVFTIGPGIPTHTCIMANAEAMARYAALCQEVGLVPIAEPEVLMEGNHSLECTEAVTTSTLQAAFAALYEHAVLAEGMLLKPNMVVPGKGAPEQASVEEVAQATVRTLRRTVPAAVPGIVFLSGGQRPEQATAHLNAMNRMGSHPWVLSFSFARALQQPAMEVWRGNPANVPQAQKIFYNRTKLAAAASRGEYSPEMERAGQ